MPEVDPAADPATWPLSGQGRAAARQIGGRLPAGALLTASDEPKAWQTLDPDGDRAVRLYRRLGEYGDRGIHRRLPAPAPVLRLRCCPRWVGAAGPGGPAVRCRRQRGTGAGRARDVVLAGHGMAMTVWLVRAVSLRDPGTFWAELRSPTFSP